MSNSGAQLLHSYAIGTVAPSNRNVSHSSDRMVSRGASYLNHGCRGAPRARAGRLARLDRPALAALIALGGWLAFVVARLAGWAHGQLSLFIASGTRYSHPALMFPRIAHVKGKGYDGQFYYRFAFDPFNWHLTAYGITIDHPYRYTRIGYSVAAWLLSGGGHGRLLPLALVLVNLAGVAAMAWLGGLLAQTAGRHALWGLLFAAYFGLVVSVGRDTSEPLADACLLGGLLAYRHRRFPLAAALIGYARVHQRAGAGLPGGARARPGSGSWREAGPGRGSLNSSGCCPGACTCCSRASSTWSCAARRAGSPTRQPT